MAGNHAVSLYSRRSDFFYHEGGSMKSTAILHLSALAVATLLALPALYAAMFRVRKPSIDRPPTRAGGPTPGADHSRA